jgi:hypothetical protein
MSTAHISLDADLRGQCLDTDRRTAKRRRFSLGSVGYLTFGEEESRQEVWLVDLSIKGIGFFSAWPLRVGTILFISLARRNDEPLTLTAKVVHSTKGAKEWLVGCEFVQRLEADDIGELL